MSYAQLMEHVGRAFEIGGVLVLTVGFILAIVSALLPPSLGETRTRYVKLRQTFGRSILLSLEVLVAADLIRTVAVEPTLNNVLGLGLIVLIRTFLSFSLEIEIEGVVPWRRAALQAALPGGWARRASAHDPGPGGAANPEAPASPPPLV